MLRGNPKRLAKVVHRILILVQVHVMVVRSVIVVKEKVNICPPQGGFFYEEMVLNRTVGDSNLQKSSEISELGVFMATTHVPDHDYDYMKQSLARRLLRFQENLFFHILRKSHKTVQLV